MSETEALATADELVARVQELQAALQDRADAATGQLADALVSAVVQLYGAGLERVMALLDDAGEDGRRLALQAGEDELLSTLLCIHDLHPVPLAERVQGALDSVRPYMESHGGNVELLGLDEGVATLRLEGSCSDCSASSVTLELAIKQALERAAPDLEGLEVEGVAPTGGPTLPAIGLPVVVAGAPAAAPSWFDVERVDALPAGGVASATVGGASLVVANVEGTLLAYRDACAGCGGPLHDGELRGGALRCPACARTFFLPRAGRSMDDERLQLEPVPLLRERGAVRVALAT